MQVKVAQVEKIETMLPSMLVSATYDGMSKSAILKFYEPTQGYDGPRRKCGTSNEHEYVQPYEVAGQHNPNDCYHKNIVPNNNYPFSAYVITPPGNQQDSNNYTCIIHRTYQSDLPFLYTQ